MERCPPESETAGLYADNTQATFWKPVSDIAPELWEEQAAHLASSIPGAAAALAAGGWPGLMCYLLGEGQFGAHHWRLSAAKRLYYRYLRSIIPPRLKPLVRSMAVRQQGACEQLSWPIEGRYVDLQNRLFASVLRQMGRPSMYYLHFWPFGRRYALVLTHDVEGAAGQSFVREVADLEERYGLVSSFNFVPEDYAVDESLLEDLRARGFEVGVHGLHHDGRLYSDWGAFRGRAGRINEHLRRWQASGFRSPLMHRHPQWLQSIEAEYDCSFFDTDPYEPIPGGTMSIWPFFLGRMVELPYTLVQDHTLTQTLGEQSPWLWFEKLAFIRRYSGMALLLTHPDYLRQPSCLRLYEQFLHQAVAEGDYWNAAPCEVSRWWRRRAAAVIVDQPDGTYASDVSGGVFGEAVVQDGDDGHSVRLSVPVRTRISSAGS